MLFVWTLLALCSSGFAQDLSATTLTVSGASTLKEVSATTLTATSVTGGTVKTSAGVNLDTLNAETVKLTGAQTIAGAKTFADPINGGKTDWTNHGVIKVSNVGSQYHFPFPKTTLDYSYEAIWSANGPLLRDTVNCANGSPGGMQVNDIETSWRGVYTVIQHQKGHCQYSSGACYQLKWDGWRMEIRNAANTIVGGTCDGHVSAHIAWTGSQWVIQHMKAFCGTAAFHCY